MLLQKTCSIKPAGRFFCVRASGISAEFPVQRKNWKKSPKSCVRVRTIRNRKSFISHMIPFIIPNRRFLSLHARTQVFGIFSRIFSILLHAGKWDGVPPTGRAVELRAHRARDGAGGVLNSPLSGLLRIVTNQPSSVLTSFGHLPP